MIVTADRGNDVRRRVIIFSKHVLDKQLRLFQAAICPPTLKSRRGEIGYYLIITLIALLLRRTI